MEKKKAKSATKTKKASAVVSKKVVTKAKVKNEVEKVVEPKVEKNITKKSNHDIFKVLAVVIIVVALLTWFIKGGSWTYQDDTGAAVVEYVANDEATRTGINELFLSTYYAINYYLIQLVFLAVIGLFYGVVSKTKGYKLMVKKTANLFKGKELVFTLVTSFIIALFASVTTQPIVILMFIPLIYSIAKELKLNKISTMLMTFGALSIGLMGLTYGSYGLNYAASYMELEATAGILNRFIILLAGYLFLNLFLVVFNKKNSNLEVTEDVFELTEESESKVKAWPYIVMFAVLFVFMILGYIGYSSVFELDVFTNFHTWLSEELTFGKDSLPVVYLILGNITEFGTWDPFTMTYIMLIMVIITKFVEKISWDQVLDNALDGLKKMAKPIALIAVAYSVFVLCYWSGITSAIINFFNSGDGFNPYFTALGNAIADFLHIDVEYTGFAFGTFYAAKYAEYSEQILAIISATSGFTALFVPTSIFVLTGLSFSNLSYKDYLKSTWKFLVGLAIILCVIFTIIVYL